MMTIQPFALERYFAKHEFSAKYLLSSSDCEPLSMRELLAMADAGSIRLWENLKLGYTEAAGHPALRESIANIYQHISRENILVVAPEEGIFLSMQALLQTGDHIICTFPGYQSLYELGRSMGCSVSLWEPREDHGWHFSIHQLEKLIHSGTKLVVVNFPHNPTGFLPARDEYHSLIDLVRQKGIYLFSDEMYRFLEVDPQNTLPAGCDLYTKAISLSGLSKAYGLPGLRIGWIATRDSQMIERMSMLKDYTTICSSAPSEILGLMAMHAREQILTLQRARIQKNLGILDDFFARYDHQFAWNRPLGGSICFPRTLMGGDTSEFCQTLVEKTGIMLVPSKVFEYGDRHVRFGFGREDLPLVIERFANYLDAHMNDMH